MNKAVFLDRDGTINVEKNYLYRINDFEFLPGVIEALKLLIHQGYKLIIITNQSGIARGYYTETEYKALEYWLINELAKNGVEITASYYCPHHPEALVEKYKYECNCRKPNLGMYERAIRENDLDIKQCIAIGDKDRDVEISKKYNIPGFKIYSDLVQKKSNIWSIKGGLLEAAEMIRNGFEDR